AGTVSYPSEEGVGSGTPSFTSGEGLGGVEVALVDGGGSDVATTTTSSDGSFTFEDVEALDSGSYTVEARTDGDGNLSGGDVDRGVSIDDARRIVTARQENPAFANADFQGEIADVNDNGSATSLDALLVARNVVFGDALSEVPTFFAPSEQASAGDSEVGLQVAAYGDANLSGGSGSDASGSSLTASQSAASLSGGPAQGSAQTAATSSEKQKVVQDRTIEVPVRLQEAAALGAYEMKLGFPADAVSFEGASVPTGAEGDLLSKAEDGTLKLGWIGTSSEEAFQVDRGGEVAVLTFALKDGVEETGLSLSLESGQLVGPGASTLEGASLGLPSLSSVTVAPEKFALNGNYPNPVSGGQTQIEMDLPSEGTVTVKVYNTLGQQVMRSRKSMQAGSGQTIRINGSDLASGQYFYRVEAE
ncbi:T9SS type A sorting domain-containing protein, partial [Salinibacter ruber]|uniref:T9SS type A sorting domain-containing protein n=1 Tax=Salinibacter ruber TaxID=146919 RepID=UPI002169FB6D